MINYKSILTQKGIKITSHKLAVLEVLVQNRHIDANDIFQQLRRKHNEISLATIYRVLNFFENEGIVNKLHFKNGQASYELSHPDNEHHDHLVCLSCGKIEEFHNEEIEKLQIQIAQLKNFTVTNHTLNLYGYCEECRNNQTTIG